MDVMSFELNVIQFGNGGRNNTYRRYSGKVRNTLAIFFPLDNFTSLFTAL